MPSGLTAVFTAPVEMGEYTVTARSTADQGRWSSATVSVVQEDGSPSVGSEGGIVASVDGVSLVLPKGVVEEGERLVLGVNRADAPALELPKGVQVLGSHYLFRVRRVVSNAPSAGGADDVATASLDGLVIAVPVPVDADRERLALGVLVPGAYVMGGGQDEWVVVQGVFDEDRGLFLAAVYRVPADGLNIVLIEHVDASTALNHSQLARGEGAISRATVPPAGTWLSSFTVTAVGMLAESVKIEYEEFLGSLVDVYRDGGFHPFLLSSTGRTFDFESWSWDYSNASYEVTVKQYEDVWFLHPFSPACSRSRSTGETTGAGFFYPVTASITLCTYGTLNSSARRTGIHELFHASQFGSPAVSRVSWDVLGNRLWIFEGTAVLSEHSMVNPGYAIERAITRIRRPVDVPLHSSGDANRYEYRAQDFFAYLGDRLGEDFRYVRHVFAEGPTAGDLEAVLGSRYRLTWADAYEGWVRHQIEDVPQNCSFLESTLIPNARLLDYRDGAKGDSSFVVGSLDTRAAIITLENRSPTQTYEWGLSYHYQDLRSRSRLYTMDTSSTTGCLTQVSSGPHVGETAIEVSAGPNEVRRLLLVVTHIEIWDRISSGFLRVVDHGYGSSPPVDVSVEPSSLTLPVSGTQSFTATVTGASDTSVSWSATCGTISGSGNTITYTASDSVGTCLVRATSVADSETWAEATVTVVESPPNATVGRVAGGSMHSLAVREDGTVWAWGANDAGQLGDGSTTDRLTPVPVVGLSNAQSVSASWWHSLAVREDGTVWAWGANYVGQLGDGSNTTHLTPVQVVGLSNVRSVSAGWEYSMAVREDGTVWAWGANYVGQLGDGSTADRLSPVQVTGLANVRSVSAGYWHSLAIREDGTVWAWGGNEYGQLGDGSTTDRLTPVQVTGIANVRSVASGYWYSVAVREDGTVWAWGANDAGQLGDGSTSDRLTPVQVVGLSNARSVSAGWLHSLVVREDGTVWAWGDNYNGQLGDGGSTARLTPVQVVGLSNAQSVSAGWEHSLAVREGGTVWAWGRNEYGQLGDGTTTDRLTPVQVSGF